MRNRDFLSDTFGEYDKNNINKVIEYMSILNSQLSSLYNFGKPFFKGMYNINFPEYLKKCFLNQDSMSPESCLKYMSELFQNIPNWNNPGTMINVIPPVNLVSVASINVLNMYNPNFAQDTYAGYTILSELEVTKYISDLVGWDYKTSGGIFTFGGKGTNLYASKIALNKADSNNRKNGCQYGKYFMVTTKTAHPCHYQVCDWIGIGSENCIEISCDDDGKINIDEFMHIVCKNIESGKYFLGVNLNGGSTNELFIDPTKEIYDKITDICSKYNLKYRPHIHVDAVIGWIYLFFKDYDFEKNELNIPIRYISQIKSMTDKASKFKYADSLGIDFHKTGFCPYSSSLFIVKNRTDFELLCNKKIPKFEDLHYGNYNPYEYTLELSRPSTGAMAALISLKSTGKNGFRRIVSNLFCSTEYFREKLSNNKEQICVINKNTEGFATLFFIKPPKYRDLDINDILLPDEESISEIRDFNVKYGKFILKKSIDGEISFNFTSSRSYVIPGTTVCIGALKAYPMSVFLDVAQANQIISEIFSTIDVYFKGEKGYDGIDAISDDMVYGARK